MTSCAASSVGDPGRVLCWAVGSAIVVWLCLRAGDGVQTSCCCPVPEAARFVAHAVGVVGVCVGELESWLRGLVPSVASRAPLGARLPMGASGAPPPPASRLRGGQQVSSSRGSGVAYRRHEGRLVPGALPLQDALLGADAASRARCLCILRGVGGPGVPPRTTPSACALASWRCVPWVLWEGAPQGGRRVPLRGLCEVSRPSSLGCPPPGRAVGVRCPCCWFERVDVGTRHRPSGVPVLLGAACRGSGGRRPSCGLPPAVMRGVWRRAPSLSRTPVPGGGWPGPVAHVSRARLVWPWRTQHRPHSLRSCNPALRAVEAAGGNPWGGCLAPL